MIHDTPTPEPVVIGIAAVGLAVVLATLYVYVATSAIDWPDVALGMAIATGLYAMIRMVRV